MRCQSKEFVVLKNYLKRVIIFCFRTRARAREKRGKKIFFFFVWRSLSSSYTIYMCESVCGTPPVRTFAVFFFERYAKMWTQRKRRRVVPLWYEKDQTKNTKKGGGDTKKDQKNNTIL